MSETLEQIALRVANEQFNTVISPTLENDILAFARRLVEALGEQEPVAWMFDQPKLNIYNWTTTLKAECERGENIRPLYTAPSSALLRKSEGA